jgi:hypothetical protein
MLQVQQKELEGKCHGVKACRKSMITIPAVVTLHMTTIMTNALVRKKFLVYEVMDIKMEAEEVEKPLTEVDLSKVVKITLCETEEIILLDIPSVYVAPESLEENLVRLANERYQQVRLETLLL